MFNLRKAIAACACLFVFAAAFAQQADSSATCRYTCSGTVYDRDSKAALPLATILVKEAPEKSVYADEHGHYRLSGLCAGKTYTLVLRHLYCESFSDSITVNGNMQRDFFLPHFEHQISEVVVHAHANDGLATQARQELSGSELQQKSGQSLGEMLSSKSGVTTLQTGSGISKPVIHGMHSNRILILNNGIRQEGQQWGSEHAPEIDPFIAERITVVKGANAVRYGSDAIAGVVLVEAPDLRDSAGIGGAVQFAGFSNNREGNVSAMIGQNFRRLPALSWRAQGTLKQGGNYRTPNYWLNNSGRRENNFSLTAGYNAENFSLETFYSQFNTSVGIFSGAHIGNLTDLYNAFNSAEPAEQSGFSYTIGRPNQEITHELLKVKSFVRTGRGEFRKGKLQLVYARQYNMRLEYDKHKPLNDSLAALNLPELKYEITTHTTDLTWDHGAAGRFSGSVGVSGMFQQNTYEGRYFIPNYRNKTAGLFWIERMRIDTALTLEAGVRGDYKHLQVFKWENNVVISPVHRFSNISGTVGLVWQVRDHMHVLVNAGTAWRAPGVNELYSNGLHHGAAAIETGDRTLTTEKAYSLITTVNWHNHKNLETEISGYYMLFDGFIYARPEAEPALTIRGAFPAFQFVQTDATLKGIDANANWRFSKQFACSVKASLLRARNTGTNEWLQLMPADRIEPGLRWKSEGRNHFRNWFAATSVQFVNKQWRVPYNSDFVTPPAAYTLLNAEAGCSLFFGKQEIEIGISATNLLNAVYRDYMDRFRYYTDATGRNIGLRIKVPFNVSPNLKSN